MLQSERENATGCLLIDLVVKQWYLENNFHLFKKKKKKSQPKAFWM